MGKKVDERRNTLQCYTERSWQASAGKQDYSKTLKEVSESAKQTSEKKKEKEVDLP